MAYAITFRQPFASAIVGGVLTHFVREWKTSFDGEFLIHAGNPNRSTWCEELQIVKSMAEMRGIEFDGEVLPTKCFLGMGRLCPKPNDNPPDGNYMYSIANVKKTVNRFQYNGQLGLWTIDDAILKLISFE